MHLNMMQPKTKVKDFLLSITKNCETLIEQTHRKAEETLEFKMLKYRETIHFFPHISIKGVWMLGLASLEVYNFTFDITQENNKLELYTDPFGSDISDPELKDKVAEVLGIPDISFKGLEHELYGPNITKIYRKLPTENSQTVGYYNLLLNCLHSSIRGFEGNLKILSSLDQNDFQLISKQNDSKFITYEIPPGLYTFEDLSEVPSRGFKNGFELRKKQRYLKIDNSDSILIESENVTLITNMISRYDIKVLRFNTKSFFTTILGFSPYCDYTNYIGYDDDYYSEKNRNLNTTIKNHLKGDVIDGSVLNGVRQPTL